MSIKISTDTGPVSVGVISSEMSFRRFSPQGRQTPLPLCPKSTPKPELWQAHTEEVQALDSYQAKTYPDGQAGASYGQSPPLVNASKPPGEWQTYDIIFESARWNNQVELVKKAVVTVLHNGVVVQNRYEFTGITDGITREVPWKSLSKYSKPHPPEVFIELQDHNNPVRFRNIWVRPLGERDKP